MLVCTAKPKLLIKPFIGKKSPNLNFFNVRKFSNLAAVYYINRVFVGD